MLTYLLGRQVGKMTAEYLTPDRSDALDEGSAMSNAMLNEQLDEQSLGDDPSILERYAAGDPPADTPPPVLRQTPSPTGRMSGPPTEPGATAVPKRLGSTRSMSA